MIYTFFTIFGLVFGFLFACTAPRELPYTYVDFGKCKNNGGLEMIQTQQFFRGVMDVKYHCKDGAVFKENKKKDFLEFRK